MRRLIPLLLLLLLLLTTLSESRGQAKTPVKKDIPRVVVVGPLGVPAGVAAKVKIWGLHIDTATELRFFEPRATARILSRAKSPVPNNGDPNRLGDSIVEAEVLLPAGTTQPSVAFVVVTPTGESAAHTLLVDGDAPPLVEQEPNNGFAQAQPVSVGAEIDGAVNGAQDVDVFRIEGKEGQRLVLYVEAARFGSPLDSILTLYDAAGRAVATNDDFDGSTDSHIEVVLPHTGRYFLSLADANDQGGPQFVYRLVVAEGK